MTGAAERLEFSPPQSGGLGRPLALAVLAHLVLVGALTLGVQWRRTAPTVEVQAELWSAVPQAAAPKLVEPPPPPPPPPPAPEPAPVVAPPPPVPVPDAQIALEKKREQERLEQEKQLAAQQREQERLEQQKREQEKIALEKKREQERLAALEKKRQQEQREKEKLAAEKKKQQEQQQAKLAQEKKQRELDEARKRAAEKQRLAALKAEADAKKAREQAQKAKEEAARLEAQRQVNLARMAGLAGATGAPGATGTALKSSGPSSSYGGRVSAIVKPNIVFTENPQDNPTALVEVRAAPDGTIVGRKLVKSSGNKAWDEAVLKAIDKTALLPRDVDGTVPQVLEINFRRRD